MMRPVFGTATPIADQSLRYSNTKAFFESMRQRLAHLRRRGDGLGRRRPRSLQQNAAHEHAAGDHGSCAAHGRVVHGSSASQTLSFSPLGATSSAQFLQCTLSFPPNLRERVRYSVEWHVLCMTCMPYMLWGSMCVMHIVGE